MGKSNRPLVVRIKPGQSKAEAIQSALSKPNAHKRNHDKIMLRIEAK